MYLTLGLPCRPPRMPTKLRTEATKNCPASGRTLIVQLIVSRGRSVRLSANGSGLASPGLAGQPNPCSPWVIRQGSRGPRPPAKPCPPTSSTRPVAWEETREDHRTHHQWNG
jgi:hypothetical protein